MAQSVTGEYLELIYALRAEGQDAYAVTLAEHFGVSRANASATVGRMVRDGLVHVEGRRLDLTEEGRVQAEAGLRRHRIAERFLVDVLGLDWAIVHDQARHFERGLSPLLEQRMDERLGYPRTCPHGNPIPRAGVNAATYLRDLHAVRLTEAAIGVPLSVLLISELIEQAPDLLRVCRAQGLLPGARVMVAERARSGAIVAQVGDASVDVEPMPAHSLWMVPADQRDREELPA